MILISTLQVAGITQSRQQLNQIELLAALVTLCVSHQPKRELTHQEILSFFHTVTVSPFGDKEKK
jgi:hypothetical protein